MIIVKRDRWRGLFNDRKKRWSFNDSFILSFNDLTKGSINDLTKGSLNDREEGSLKRSFNDPKRSTSGKKDRQKRLLLLLDSTIDRKKGSLKDRWTIVRNDRSTIIKRDRYKGSFNDREKGSFNDREKGSLETIVQRWSIVKRGRWDEIVKKDCLTVVKRDREKGPFKDRKKDRWKRSFNNRTKGPLEKIVRRSDKRDRSTIG